MFEFQPRMENITQSKSRWYLIIPLFPISCLIFLLFSLYSLRHRKQYKGSEEYSSRYFFLKRVYWFLYQIFPQKDVLIDKEQLGFKNSLVVVYCPYFSFFSIYLAFLISNFYEKNYQIKKSFRICTLHSKKAWWEFFLSSIELFREIPARNFLKESDESIVYFVDSIESLKEIIKNSYRTLVFFKLNSSFNWFQGYKRIYSAIGKVTLKERLKNLREFNAKLEKIFSNLTKKEVIMDK